MKLIFITCLIGLVALCSIEVVRAEEDAILDELDDLLDESMKAATDPKATLQTESTPEEKAEMAIQLQKLIAQIEQMGVMIAEKQKEAEEEEARRRQEEEDAAERLELEADNHAHDDEDTKEEL